MMYVTYLTSVEVEPLDGDRRAAGTASGEPEDAPVDAPEAALADHEQRAEVARSSRRPNSRRAPLSSYSSGMLRADDTETEPDDTLTAGSMTAGRSSDFSDPERN